MTDRDTVVAHIHGSVEMQTADGGRETVAACKIRPDDINEDGTISMPLTWAVS